MKLISILFNIFILVNQLNCMENIGIKEEIENIAAKIENSTDESQIHLISIELKKFIDGLIDKPESYHDSIKAIRYFIKENPNDILDTLSEYLNLNFNRYLQSILFKIELSVKKENKNSNDDFNMLVGNIVFENGSIATGTLIPIPNPVNNDIKWHVLTAAHIINAIPRIEKPNYQVHFTSNIKEYASAIPLKGIKIFKEKGRGIKITYPTTNTFTINSMSTQDIRTTLSYNNDNDLALCELDISAEANKVISESLLNTKYLPNFSSDRLIFKLKNDKFCILYFFGNRETSSVVREANQKTNVSLGYADIGNGIDLFICEKRDENTKIQDSPNNFIYNISNLNFSYDAPGHPGMSGGPIFYIDRSGSAHIYGVISGLKNEYESHGVFIGDRLFLHDSGVVKYK
jgi:hypothetical protein